jgi:hypothetical protein
MAKRKGKKSRFRIFAVRAFLVIALWYAVFPPFVLPVHGRTSSRYFLRFSPDGRFPWIEFHSGTD